MGRYDEREELAPRDVVSRSIVAELHRVPGAVRLDLTHLDAGFVSRRFPRIYETCLHYGVDLARQPVPVHPAAHYAMGGILTDGHGATTVPGLYAAGEAAATGVHGAGRSIRKHAGRGRAVRHTPVMLPPEPLPANAVFLLRQLAWRYIGITRSGEGLRQGIEELEQLRPSFDKGLARNSRHGFEADNMYEVVQLITRCALAREESRGCHFRVDYPESGEAFQKRSRVTKGSEVSFY